MEHLRSSDPVNIALLTVSIDQRLIPGKMFQHTQLDLGIIRIHENETILGHKHLPKQSSQFRPNRDILKIWLCTADPACSGNRLIKCTVDTAIPGNTGQKSVCIGGFQLRQLAVFQNV